MKDKKYLMIFALIFAVAMALRFMSHGVPDRLRTYDEYWYGTYSGAAALDGIESTRKIVDDYRKDPTSWAYPPPTRVGFHYLTAIFVKIFGPDDIMKNMRVIAWMSIFWSALSIILLYSLGAKIFGSRIALIASAIMAVSPVDLALARRAWQDNFVAFLALVLLYMMYLIIKFPKNRGLHAIFGALGGYLLLVKESGAVIYALIFIWIAVIMVHDRLYKEALSLSMICGAAAALSITVLAAMFGGMNTIIEVIKGNLASVHTSPYAVGFQTGSTLHYLYAIFLMNPVELLMLVPGVAIVLSGSVTDDPLKRKSALGLIFFFAAFFSVSLIPDHMINLRYISALYPVLYLMSACGIWGIITIIRKRFSSGEALTVALLIISLIFAAVLISDYARFKSVFLDKPTNDLSLKFIISGSFDKVRR